ncbi:MAG: hypothetical protein V1494_01830 [Candidatus Diapherotrites archaeon]
MIDLASDKKMRIVEFLLEKKEFTQYGVKKELRLGMSIVNQTFSFLLDKGVIGKPGKKYALKDPVGLIELTAFFRSMEKLKIMEISTSLEKKDVLKILPDKSILCLEIALEKYSNYYVSNRICFYADGETADKFKKKLSFKPGNKTVVIAYREKPKALQIETFGKHKFTARIRTIIDLFSDKKGNAAEALVRQLWGKNA